MTAAERLQANPSLYRAELSCSCGKSVIQGDTLPPKGLTREAWAIYLLLAAVEDLARGMAEKP